MPAALEHVDLGRVAVQDQVARTPPRAARSGRALLDQRHLVAHRDERARDVRADLAAAGDDHVHQRARLGAGIAARTASASTAIAVCGRADRPQAARGVELGARRVEHAHDDAVDAVALLRDLADRRCSCCRRRSRRRPRRPPRSRRAGARRRPSRGRRTKPPRQCEPSRASASSARPRRSRPSPRGRELERDRGADAAAADDDGLHRLLRLAQCALQHALGKATTSTSQGALRRT